MRRTPHAMLPLALLGAGCASRHDTGSALVGAGTAVAIVSAMAATDSVAFTPQGMARQTSKNGAAAAAGVGAGVALAAVGAAVAKQPSSDGPPRASTSAVARNAQPWRLVRPAEDPSTTSGTTD